MNMTSFIDNLLAFQRKMDFFADEGLPEHIVLRVMQHLDNNSLLKFGKCNKKLKKLLGSKKFASRFSLHLNFNAPWKAKPKEKWTVAEIEEIHQRIVSSSRKYTNLTLKHFVDFIDTAELQAAALALLRMLGETVKEVTIEGGYVDWSNAEDFAQMLSCLRNITKYTLRNIEQNDSNSPIIIYLFFRDKDFSFMETVEELELCNCFDYILNAFSSCSNLKRFAITDYRTWRSAGVLNGFLLSQTQLEHLEIVSDSIESDFDYLYDLQGWQTFSFKLKSLDVYHTQAELYLALGFFDQQKELESLGISIKYVGSGDDNNEEAERSQLHNTIAFIWSLPMLKNLELKLYCDGERSILPETFFDDLPRNNTIERITLRCGVRNFVRLLNTLDAVKRIDSGCYNSHLDLSGLRLDVIAKIVSFNEDHLTYAPEEVPDNSDEFEKIFGKLLELQRGSQRNSLETICIGHPSWLRHQDEFQLSLEFCKRLVKSAPDLEELELYKVHPDFAAYLVTNMPKNLKVIELHTADSSSNRMKLDNS